MWACGTFNNSGFIVDFTVIIIIIYGAAAVTHQISLWKYLSVYPLLQMAPDFWCVLQETVIKGQEVGSNRLQS